MVFFSCLGSYRFIPFFAIMITSSFSMRKITCVKQERYVRKKKEFEKRFIFLTKYSIIFKISHSEKEKLL